MADTRIKRKDLSLSPEAQHDKQKILRSSTSHISFQDFKDLESSSISGNTTHNPHSLLVKCNTLGINGSPTKTEIDADYVYALVIKLEARVTKQEEEVASLQLELQSKDNEVFKLRQDNAHLHQQVSDMRRDSLSCDIENNDKCMLPTEDQVFIAQMRREIPLLSEAVSKIESVISDVKTQLDGSHNCDNTEVEIVNLNEKLQSMSDNLKSSQINAEAATRRAYLEGDQRDQYSRRETVRVMGVPQKRGENTNEIMCQIGFSLGVQLSESDISVSHRSGRQNGDIPRPILVKFARRDIKHQILQNKRMARHIKNDPEGRPVSIFIDEHLTPMRAGVCKRLREDKIRHHTKDGKIFLNIGDDTWKVLDSPEDWESLDWSVNFKEELGIYPKK